MVTVPYVFSRLNTSWKSVVFTNKVGKTSQYFVHVGVFNNNTRTGEIICWVCLYTNDTIICHQFWFRCLPGKPRFNGDNAELFINYSQVGNETIRHHSSLRHFECYLTNVYVSPFKTITSCCRSSVIKITWEMWKVLNSFYINLIQFKKESTLYIFLAYLGYRKESISPMDNNVDAITNKPPPKECVRAKVASEIFHEMWVRFFKRQKIKVSNTIVWRYFVNKGWKAFKR